MAHDQAAEMAQPGKGEFDNPARQVAAELVPVRVGGPAVVSACRNDQLNPAAHKASLYESYLIFVQNWRYLDRIGKLLFRDLALSTYVGPLPCSPGSTL